MLLNSSEYFEAQKFSIGMEEGSGNNSNEHHSIMGRSYKQCNSARVSTITRQIVNVNIGTGGLNSGMEPVTVKYDQIGSLENTDDYAKSVRTFRGSRVCKGDKVVNESFTSSIDPQNLSCIGCAKEHKILDSTGPLIIALSDQNMDPILGSGCNESCVITLRLENSSLDDLAGLLCEIFDGRGAIPPGTVVLAGSLSHLSVSGAAKYAREWCLLCTRLEKKFTGIRICPLVPLVKEDLPGPVAYELMKLAFWYSRVYAGNTSGLIESWAHFLTMIATNMTGHTPLTVPFTDPVEMPADLSGIAGRTQVIHFVFNSSSPVRVLSPDRVALNELVSVLATTLGRDLGLSLDPGVVLQRVTEVSAGTDNPKNKEFVTVGASILNRISGLFFDTGSRVVNLCCPGWTADPMEVKKLEEKMAKLDISPNTVFIMDLLGNSSYRCEEFDGTLSRIKKSPEGYHVNGPVAVVDDGTMRRLISLVAPIYKLVPDSCIKIIVPPLPRYLFSGCCNSPDHCTNRTTERYPEKFLSKNDHLRNLVKSETNRLGLKNHWVLDSSAALAGGEGVGPLAEKMVRIRDSLAPDGVHLTATGTKRIYNGILDAISRIERQKQTGNGSGNAARRNGFYWRGFISPVGSATRGEGGGGGGPCRSGDRQGRDRRYGNHPYHRADGKKKKY